MIYMEPLQLGWKALVTSWMESDLADHLSDDQKATVGMLFDWLLPPCLSYVTKSCRQFEKCHQMHLTMSMLKLYGCMLEEVR